MVKFMAFLFILFVVFMGYFAFMNTEDVSIRFAKDHPHNISKTAFVLLSAGAGAFLTLLVFVVRDTRRFVFNIQHQQKVKKEDKIKSLYSRALDEYFAQRWEDAQGIFEQILKEDPEHINSLLKLGDIAYNDGEFKKSFEYFNRAHSLDPSWVETLFALTKVKESTNSYADALMYVDEILDVDEDNVRAYYKKRELLEKMERWDDLVYLQKSILKSKPAEDEREREQRILIGYKYESGRNSLENAELEKAQKAFRTVIRIDKSFIPAHLGLAEVMLREENTNDAVNYLEDIFKQTHSIIALARIEDLLINMGEPARLIRIYRNALTDDPKNNALKLLLGKLYYRLEMLDDASGVLETLDSSSLNPEISKIVGNIYLKRNQPERAVEEFKKVIDMKKAFRLPYSCSHCGFFAVEWSGRCPSCKNWDTYQFDILTSSVPKD